MNAFHSLLRCFVLFVMLTALRATLHAQDEPQELSDAKQAYKKEVEFATRSIRERYLMKLDALKRSLGARGDFRAALAVDEEVENVKANALEAGGIEKFAGTWKMRYSNSVIRRYVINGDGYVTCNEENGQAVAPRKGKIALRKSQYFIEFVGGEIEKISIIGNTLATEIFAGKDAVATGVSLYQGTGAKELKAK